MSSVLTGGLAAELRCLQRWSGQSLRELERTTFASHSSLARYLSGQTVPPWAVVEALCRVGGRDPGELRALWEHARRARLGRRRSASARRERAGSPYGRASALAEPGAMWCRRLGASGPSVSAVGVGCDQFGLTVDRAGARAIVEAALDAGVTLFDTVGARGSPPGATAGPPGAVSDGPGTAARPPGAAARPPGAAARPPGAAAGPTGAAEELLGAALAVTARRADVVIATTSGEPAAGHGAPIAARGAPARRGEQIRRAVEASLRRLGTDYIDLYQVRAPDPGTPIDEMLAALHDLVQSGKVRHVGCVDFAAWQVADAAWTAWAGRFTPFVSVRHRRPGLDREAQAELVPVCERFGLGLLPSALLPSAAPPAAAAAIRALATRPSVVSVIASVTSADEVRAIAAAVAGPSARGY
jgi:aryl-alcohol dehydrogenase-like predicted oxidoreductase